MKTILFAAALSVGLECTLAAQSVPATFSCSGGSRDSAEILALESASPDNPVAAAAITRLRALGPQGLEALLKAHASEIAQGGAGSDQDWQRLKLAIDGVSAQCDGYASGLYWYTDFDQAKAAARTAGKPILSLRLLGKLNEEYSCANSRFFRTTLYANSEVSRYLRAHFILHWQSVRPVPKLTIDFGDGRKLERTITGNSVHYILDQDGQAVDALPGLYGPKAFLRALSEAEDAALSCAKLSQAERRTVLRQHHLRCRAAANRQFQADLNRLEIAPVALVRTAGLAGSNVVPTAVVAGKLAVSKSAMESPVLRMLQPKGGNKPAPMRGELEDAMWSKLATFHAEDAQLDPASRALIARKSSSAWRASELTLSKRLVEDPLLRTLRNLERSISEDTVRNEFLLHTQIHDWFIQDLVPENVDMFNTKVYADLFLMPENDPWLGLAPGETFTALPAEGLAGVGER